MRHPSPQAVVDYFDRIGESRIMPRLGEVQAVLERMHNPHRRFPSLLIAGTNGKGSTGAMLEAILRHAGYRTGFFSSPHLHAITERFRVDGRDISRARLASLVGEVCRRLRRPNQDFRRVFDSFPLTYFEWNTVLAFLLFEQDAVDIAVLEVGLGGRLDSTNTVDPLISIVTPVGLDHQRFLGNTKREILGEKLGITRPGTPLVTTIADADLVPHVDDFARSSKIPLHRLNREMRLRSHSSTDFEYEDDVLHASFTTRMPGAHQHINAAGVVRACVLLRDQGWEIADADLAGGLKRARLHGRLEQVHAGPNIYLDGAHNPLAARAVNRFLHSLDLPRPPRIFATASRGHPLPGFMRALAGTGIATTFAPMRHPRAVPGDELHAAWTKVRLPGRAGHGWADDAQTGLRLMLATLKKSDTLLVCGSLFFIEPARRTIAEFFGATGEDDD